MPQRATPFHTTGAPGEPGPGRPSVRERGRMRRRLREQRRMREALLLDLGALVFELQRQGRREPELLQAKAAELSAVDREVRALATALDAGHGVLQLVATGVAGSCANCGSLLSTDARYCQACGAPAVPSLAPDRRGGDAALSSAAPPPHAIPQSPPPPRAPLITPQDPAAGRGAAPERAGADSRRPALTDRIERMRELVRRRSPRG